MLPVNETASYPLWKDIALYLMGAFQVIIIAVFTNVFSRLRKVETDLAAKANLEEVRKVVMDVIQTALAEFECRLMNDGRLRPRKQTTNRS